MAISERAGKQVHVEDGERAPWVGQHMTLDEFLALPEVKPYLEYDDGVVRQKMSPKFVDVSVQGVLNMRLNQAAGPQRLGWARPELRFVTPAWAPVPDVSFYLRGRIRRSAVLANEDIQVAPDIAIEIVSPGQSVTGLIAKCLRYLTLGTKVALIVDPGQETVLALRPDSPIQVMRDDDRIDIGDVLPDFELTVRELFGAIVSDLPDDEDAPDVGEAAADEQASSA